MTLLQNWRISISLIISVTVHTNFLIYKCTRAINITNTHTCKMITFSTLLANIIHAFKYHGVEVTMNIGITPDNTMVIPMV